MDDLWGVVRDARRQQAQEAFVAAFGAGAPTELAPLSGGISAAIYRIDLGGRSYVLRLEGRRGGVRDPHRSYTCLSAAARAGIAPRVHHADPVAGIAILDYVRAAPFSDYPGGPTALSAELGRIVARLQATAPFPEYTDYPELIRRMFTHIQRSTLFAPGLLNEHNDVFEHLVRVYPWRADTRVSSHNDVNPRNVIYDGDRLWLIDWETAFRNDPFVDLAIMTAETAITPEDHIAMLTGWRGHPPNRDDQDRLAVMAPLARLYHACLLLTPFAAKSPDAPIMDLAAPTSAQFTQQVETGRLRIGSQDLSIALAKMLLVAFLGLANAAETIGATRRLA